MDKTKTCYLFFDLDGTVLTHQGKLEKETLETMLAVQAMGHKLILNTGRSQGGYKLAPAAHTIPWDGACFSSSDIFFGGRLLSESTVPEEDFFAWLEYCMEQRIDVRYCGRETQVLFDFSRYSAPMTGEEQDSWRQLAQKEFETNVLTNLSVMSVLPLDDRLPKTNLKLYQLPTYVDLFAPGCDKGSVVRKFCCALDIPLEQCVGFGDSTNDVDMLAACSLGICMKNSPQILIDTATYHAKTENGVREGLEMLFGV